MELIAEGLSCRRAGRRVFADVALRAVAGRALWLNGPNGAGKSSLLRVLAGLIPPEAGAAKLGGATLRDPEGWRAQLAYAGHLDAVKPQFSVAGNLRAWAAIYGGGGVEAALAAFGLGGIADLPAAYCSAGQKRRLGLARLLVAQRPLWLLDEPTVSLDAAAVATFAGVLRAHLAAGGLAVAATHVAMGLEGDALRLEPPAPERVGAADPFLQGFA